MNSGIHDEATKTQGVIVSFQGAIHSVLVMSGKFQEMIARIIDAG